MPGSRRCARSRWPPARRWMGRPPRSSRRSAARRFTVEAIEEREKVTDHDTAAFVDVLAASAGPAGRWIHYGLTSSDVLDTGLALQLRRVGELVLPDSRRLVQALAARAREHVHTLCVGRTHGIHAEPTTFGIKLAGFAFEADRNARRLERAFEQVAVGAISGRRRYVLRDVAGLRGTGAAAARAGARARLHAGGGTRPPRRAAPGGRARGRGARAVRDRASPPGADRGRRGARAVRRRAEGLELDAAQAQPDQVRAGRRVWRACSAATPRPRSRTSRCGTSATSLTHRSSGSSCPTRRPCSTTCSGA